MTRPRESAVRMREDGIPSIERPGLIRNAVWGARLLTENLCLRCRLPFARYGSSKHAFLADRLSDNYARMGFRDRMSEDLERAAMKYNLALRYAQDDSKRGQQRRRMVDCISRIAESYEVRATEQEERLRKIGLGTPVIEGESTDMAPGIIALALYRAACHRKLAAEVSPTASDASQQYGLAYGDCQRAIEALTGPQNRMDLGCIITLGLARSLLDNLSSKVG